MNLNKMFHYGLFFHSGVASVFLLLSSCFLIYGYMTFGFMGAKFVFERCALAKRWKIYGTICLAAVLYEFLSSFRSLSGPLCMF